MSNSRLKDVLGGLMVGVIACLILMACGSDNSNATQSKAQATQILSNTAVNNGAGVSTIGQALSGGNVPAINQGGQVAQLNPTGNLNQDIRNVIKATRPAVVLIAAQITRGDDFGGVFGRSQQVEQGVGTGSIITPDGFIITNNHVIEGATSLTVVLPDGRTYKGRVVGREGRTSDIAIVKIDPKAGETLPTIRLGDSSKLEVGEAVVAIGNALGLENGPTVTAGIVGALGRSIQEPNGAQLTAMIQTDAAINPGNSGGPLLNLRGEQIGINTAAAVDQSQGVAAQGIGFALSINENSRFITAYTSGGNQPQVAARPFIGILPQTMTAALAARYSLPSVQGVLIARVDPNTPAAAAGFQAGDILVRMDGTVIKSLDDLASVLARHKPNDRVSATVVNRQNQQREVSLTFGTTGQ